MNKFIGTVLALILPVTFILANNITEGVSPSNNVKFFAGSFENAKVKAGNEGKLFFVEFYADWCTPCKWMDKTTFKDENVVSQLNQNYVPLKLDIESNEGQNLKNQYEVKILPTILIFNSQGRMIERVEKTLSSESMNTLLSFHDNPENRIVINHSINKSPINAGGTRGPNLDNLFSQYQIAERFRTNYKLQVGFYFDYSEAYNRVKSLKEEFAEPIVVMNDYVENTTQYKVLMGEFKTMSEAESYRKILKKNHDIDAIIY
ncbi:MAG: thioredoxin fold domain-containing protein [Saprospiraceae bacterium]|nr:thioredoxin family protein [Bacteroidia bacterium]NNE16352.1 thioredoxin fold domain-containing protein [Saprospiraceae bacterium]NNL91108.1 thioredoxin fold domain-containing protein [Saprospiraceae bacterium]